MSEQLTVTRLLTAKNDVGRTRIQRGEEEVSASAGEVILRLERFSLSTNNLTYAGLGESMKFWNFFPASCEDWGHMPVWGFADVTASRVDGIEIGERVYGYFPIATHIRMRPERVTARGFFDGAAHRRELPSIYNRYERCASDPAYLPHLENQQALLGPLFVLSFMLADFLADNDFFGAKQAIVSSASSKAAYGTAFCIGARDPIRVIGLTSERNRDFVRDLGCYDQTVSYCELGEVDRGTPTVYVDFSGDEALRTRVHAYFGDALTYDCFVGLTANTDLLPDDPRLVGPRPMFFFVATQIKKRNADWGAPEVARRLAEVQRRFFERVSSPDSPWVSIVEHTGFEAAQRVIAALAANSSDPREGHVVRLGQGVPTQPVAPAPSPPARQAPHVTHPAS